MRILISAIALLQANPTGTPAAPPAQQAAKPDPGVEPAEPDIVVSSKRDGPPRVLPTVPDYLRRLCFDPARLTRHFAPPEDDADWEPLDGALRRQFRAADATIPAFRLDDNGRQRVVLLRFDSFKRPDGMLTNQCVFAVIGPVDEDELIRGTSRIFGTPPANNHVGRQEGTPEIKNWKQWLWSGNPDRRTQAWHGYDNGGFIFVTDLRFYNSRDYIFADLKIRKDGKLAMLSFGFVSAPPLVQFKAKPARPAPPNGGHDR